MSQLQESDCLVGWLSYDCYYDQLTTLHIQAGDGLSLLYVLLARMAHQGLENSKQPHSCVWCLIWNSWGLFLPEPLSFSPPSLSLQQGNWTSLQYGSCLPTGQKQKLQRPLRPKPKSPRISSAASSQSKQVPRPAQIQRRESRLLDGRSGMQAQRWKNCWQPYSHTGHHSGPDA